MSKKGEVTDTQRKKRAFLTRQTKGDRCYYCGKILTNDFVVDHFVPTSKGGAEELSNWVPCCPSCNSQKGTQTVDEFRASMALKKGMSFTLIQRIYWKRHMIELPEDIRFEFYFDRLPKREWVVL